MRSILFLCFTLFPALVAIAGNADQSFPTDAEGQRKLGIMYIGSDDDMAFFWTKKAAEQGDGIAQNNLGVMYENGVGIKKDADESLKWISKAAKNDIPEAQYTLAMELINGGRLKKDPATALNLLEKSANKGHSQAQLELGLSYLLGDGTKKDYKKAIYWQKKSAEQGNNVALFNLGVHYLKGAGVKADGKIALSYFERSCKEGNQGGCDVISSYKSPQPQKENTELTFVNIIKKSQSESLLAKNDMQRGGIKSIRDENLCAILKSKKIKNWDGFVTKISANEDGRGVLSVKIANGITLKTWNNSYSDSKFGTLIDQKSELFTAASSLEEGDHVVFSGEFYSGNSDAECIYESSIGLRGGLQEPEFIFKFDKIHKI